MFDPRLLDGHVFVDIETTGLDAATSEIIELSAVFIRNGAIERESSWLIRPGHALPATITALTGLTDEALEGAPSFAELLPSLEGCFDGWVVVAHNALFERSFLKDLLRGPVLDSCELALILFPELPSHSLDALVRWTGQGDGARHRALDDAKDTFAVVRTMLDRSCEPSRRLELSALSKRVHGPMSALLAKLSDAAFDAPTPATVETPSTPPPALFAELSDWVKTPRAMAFELELPDLEDVIAEAAHRTAARHGSVWVIGSASRQRRFESLERLPPRSTWKTGGRWEALTARRAVVDPALSTALAYLESWGRRAPDVAGPSGFFRDRVPLYDGMRALLKQPRTALPGPGTFCGTHGDAAEWLEAGVRPAAIIWLDPATGIEVERRRLSTSLDVVRLARLPELVELAAPGRPTSAALVQLHEHAGALFERLARRPDTSDPEGWWAQTRIVFEAIVSALDRLVAELEHGPRSPLIDAVVDEARALRTPAASLLSLAANQISFSATGLATVPTVDTARASWHRLVQLVPTALVSDVRRPDAWATDIVRVGTAQANGPIRIVDGLATHEALATAALIDRRRVTVLIGEPLVEALVRAFTNEAARQGRAARLNTTGAGPNDVIVKEWWGGAMQVDGPVIVVSPRDPLALRRLVAAKDDVHAVLFRDRFPAEHFAKALEGLPLQQAAEVQRAQSVEKPKTADTTTFSSSEPRYAYAFVATGRR